MWVCYHFVIIIMICAVYFNLKENKPYETHFHKSLPHLLDLITRSLSFQCLNVLIYTRVPLQKVVIPLSSIALCIFI